MPYMPKLEVLIRYLGRNDNVNIARISKDLGWLPQEVEAMLEHLQLDKVVEKVEDNQQDSWKLGPNGLKTLAWYKGDEVTEIIEK